MGVERWLRSPGQRRAPAVAAMAAPATGERPLPPAGLRLRLDPGVRRRDGGRVLIGGSPLRLLRLSAAGAGAVDELAGGRPVGPSVLRRRLARGLLDGGLAHPVVAHPDGRPPHDDPPGAPAMGPADVTAIVPVYDDAAGLDRTLTALDADVADGLLVVVVDDGSPSAAAVAVAAAAAGHGARLLGRLTNGGPAAARNTGLAAAAASGRPLVAFLDADTSPRPGWLAPLLAHLADPAVVAVAPRVRSERGDDGTLARYERRHSPLDMGPVPARVALRSRLTYVPSAALVARRAAVDEVGAFAEELRYGEDVDLVWRLSGAGGIVRYEPASVVGHAPRPSWRAWFSQRAAYGTAAAPLARRHPGQVPPLAVSGWSIVAWGLLAVGHPLAGLGVAAASVVSLAAELRPVLPEPVRDALRLAAWGHSQAGLGLARALTRTWWPLALAGALVERRLGRVLLVAALTPGVADWRRSDGLPLATHVALRLAGDVAYGAGVWKGCWSEGTLAPLLPQVGPGPLVRRGS